MATEKEQVPHELIAPSADFLQVTDRIGLHWWYWETTTRQLTLSPGLLRILGHTEESYDYKPESAFIRVHPEDIEQNYKRLGQLLHGEVELYEMAYRVKDDSGVWQWYYNRGAVRKRDEEGNPLQLGGITINISGQYKDLMAMVEEKEKFEFIFTIVR